MKVAIRTDASVTIGSGHVMRCLSLAGELAARGAQIHFVCRDLPDHLRSMLASHGHALAPLRGEPANAAPSRQTETPWPEAAQAGDSRDTLTVLASHGPFDWIAVDHYAAGQPWEESVVPLGARRLAVDDLGRTHACELLLDQNLYPEGAARYDGRVNDSCTRLVGPHFALLRPEFRAAHEAARVRVGPVTRLLIFIGGMDASNVTMTALRAIGHLTGPLPAIDVVIGPTHPARNDVEAACTRLGAICHIQTSDMASLCARADLAIGAGGSATWERCTTGLPALVLAVAANQREIARNGDKFGLHRFADIDTQDDKALADHLRSLMADDALRTRFSRRALTTVDGRGSERVAQAMETP